MTGISAEKRDNIRRLIRFASAFAASNFTYSGFCELRRRMSAAPKMLSLITLFNQSIASCDFTKSFRTLPKTKKKRAGEERHDQEDGERQLPIRDKQKHGDRDNEEDRGDERRERPLRQKS